MQVERREEEPRKHRRRPEDADHVGGVQRRRAEQAERHQWRGDARLDGDEERQQDERRAEQPERLRRRPAGVVGADDRVDREHQRGGDRDRTGDVEPHRRAFFVRAGQERDAEAEHGCTDRQVDEEDPVPVVGVREDAAEHHADRSAAGADEAVHAHRLGALVCLSEELHEQGERDRVDDRPADPLHRARGDERQLRARETARQRRAGEEDDADHEDVPVSVEVAEPAAEEEEPAAGEQVCVEDPDQRRLAEAEVSADRGQRDVDDRRVEHDHQHAEADDGEREPAARSGDRRIGGELLVARRHRTSASSSTSIQWRTGVAVPPCRCWMQPMLAETIVSGASAASCVSLRSRSAVASSGCSTE